MIRLVSKMVFLMVVFFIISGITAYFTVSHFIRNEETVVVPKLVGEDIVNVLELMTGLGLNARVKGSEYSQDFAKNSIIYQDPPAGEVIKRGRDVRIIISKGTKMLSMPNLKGLDLQQARLILDKNGLSEGTLVKTYHPGIMEGRVIAQYPTSAINIERGVSVDLLISMGARPEERAMPDLEGRFLDEAVLTAEKNHLVVNTIKTVYEKDQNANIVLKQNPPAGYYVMKNASVDIEVNRRTDHRRINRTIGNRRDLLFRYRLPPGYLKQHIRLELKAFDTSFVIYDELMAPGREIWIVLPAYSVSVVFLYKNEQLILSKIFD